MSGPAIAGGWTQRSIAGSHNWVGIASSSNGTNLALADRDDGSLTGSIWTSTNSGSSWTERTLAGSRVWQDIGISTDGSFIAACWTNSAADQGVAYSSDSGATWSTNTVAGGVTLNWIAVSGDGTKIVVTDGDAATGNVYLSINSGANFAASAGAGSRIWRGIDISRDGSTIVATSSAAVMISTNAGTTWNDRTPSAGSWAGVAVSSTGTKIGISEGAGGVFYSTNSGVAFTELPSTTTFDAFSVAISDDGATLLVDSLATGILKLSTNSGSTWTDQSPPSSNWNSLALSADGSKGAAVDASTVWVLS